MSGIHEHESNFRVRRGNAVIVLASSDEGLTASFRPATEHGAMLIGCEPQAQRYGILAASEDKGARK